MLPSCARASRRVHPGAGCPMKIALIAPPFIPVPPVRYGGTELHLAHLARGLRQLGHHPVVFANGESSIEDAELRYLYPRAEWPLRDGLYSSLKDLNHSGWACREAAADCDLIHLHNAPGLTFSRYLDRPVAYTVHHPWEPPLAEFYRHFPAVQFVAISRRQALGYRLPRLQVIPHGLDMSAYRPGGEKREWLAFLGRIAPIKGVHAAIAVARRCGLPLKIAGEIQPLFRDYWEQRIRPQLDRQIEYIGEVGLEGKNELLGRAVALLFPIEWEEPFGLVMVEAMACGAPVLAFARGAAPEIVSPRVSGWLCQDVDEMARRAADPGIPAASCRAWAAAHFSLERMAADYAALYQHMLLSAPRPAASGQPAVLAA